MRSAPKCLLAIGLCWILCPGRADASPFADGSEETDVVALATWLVTFKNTSVNTPKPIKKK